MGKDTMTVDDKNMVVCLKDEDLEKPEIFLKLTEEKRRERQRRIDAGDETARLKFTPPLVIQRQKEAEAKVRAEEQKKKLEEAKKKAAEAAAKKAAEAAAAPAATAGEGKEAGK